MDATGTSDRRPLILFIAPYFPPAYYGGVVQIYLGLLSRLTQFRIVVVTDRCGSNFRDQQIWDATAGEYGITVRRMAAFELHLRSKEEPSHAGSRFRFTDSMQKVLSFYRNGRREWNQLLSQYQPDMVVCGGTYSAGWLTHGLSRSLPLVNYIHGEELTMEVSPRLLMPQMRRWQMRSIRRAQLNVVVSAYTARMTEMLARTDPARIVIVSNFIDTSRFHVSGHRAELRAKRDWVQQLVILTLARLEPRKGIDQAMRALALLARQEQLPSNWIYVIAGRGRERKLLEDLSRELGIASHVTFLGFVPDGEVPALYEAADVFLQPNREIRGDTEGFGVVFLEASACGLPVIGGIAGGTADAIEEGVTGYRVDAESAEAIARVLRPLCADTALRLRLGSQGTARVRADFTVDHAAKRFGDLLEGVLMQHRGC